MAILAAFHIFFELKREREFWEKLSIIPVIFLLVSIFGTVFCSLKFVNFHCEIVDGNVRIFNFLGKLNFERKIVEANLAEFGIKKSTSKHSAQFNQYIILKFKNKTVKFSVFSEQIAVSKIYSQLQNRVNVRVRGAEFFGKFAQQQKLGDDELFALSDVFGRGNREK